MRSVIFRRVFKAVSLFFVLAGAIVLLRAVEPSRDAYAVFVDRYIASRGMYGVAVYMLCAALLTCVSVPRQLVSFAGGYAFGAVFGTLWATLGVTLGSILTFCYARFLGRDFIHARFGRRLAGIEDFIARSPFAMTFIVRSLPVGSNLLTNIAAGVTRIPALPFFLGSAAGYVPQNFVFAMLGSGVRLDPFWRTMISAAVYAVSVLFGFCLYKKYRIAEKTPEDSENPDAS